MGVGLGEAAATAYAEAASTCPEGGNVESLVWDGREVWGTVGAGACGGVGAAADDGRRGVKGGAGAACGQAVGGPLGRNTRRRWGRLSRGRGRGRLVRL